MLDFGVEPDCCLDLPVRQDTAHDLEPVRMGFEVEHAAQMAEQVEVEVEAQFGLEHVTYRTGQDLAALRLAVELREQGARRRVPMLRLDQQGPEFRDVAVDEFCRMRRQFHLDILAILHVAPRYVEPGHRPSADLVADQVVLDAQVGDVREPDWAHEFDFEGDGVAHHDRRAPVELCLRRP